MKLRSRTTAAGVVTLITLAICFFGVRDELARGQRSGNQRAPQVGQLDRGEADGYCARHFCRRLLSPPCTASRGRWVGPPRPIPRHRLS
jgi:hypothetical protein